MDNRVAHGGAQHRNLLWLSLAYCSGCIAVGYGVEVPEPVADAGGATVLDGGGADAGLGDAGAGDADRCPSDLSKNDPGLCGCGVPDMDSDADGIADCKDGCSDDANKVSPGLCGCHVPDIDGDGDEIPDCVDACAADPEKVAPGECGCGTPDTDADSDGTADCHDGCPMDAGKRAPGSCGCGTPDTDTDGDGTPDCNDVCPGDPGKLDPGVCDCGAPDEDYNNDGNIDCPVDTDDDGVLADGDLSGVAGDNPCRDGSRENCDDNCPGSANPWQDDGDNDGVGDRCDTIFCRKSDIIVMAGYDDNLFFTTNHGQDWTTTGTDGGSRDWEDVVHGRGTWLVGNGWRRFSGWARSTNGMDWTAFEVDAWMGVTSVEAVGYADGLWLLGSEDGDLAVSNDDGRSFQVLGTIEGWEGLALESMAVHEGRLIVVGDAGYIAMTDTPEVLGSWQTRTLGSQDLKQLKVVHGTWVATGSGDACYFSTDRGESWAYCGARDLGSSRGLGYLNGTWMLGQSRNGVAFFSSLPGSWTHRATIYEDVGAVHGDCQAAGHWIAASFNGDRTMRAIITSDDDGASWNVRYQAPGRQIYGIAGN